MKNLTHHVDCFSFGLLALPAGSLAVTVGTDIKCHKYTGPVQSLATFYTAVIE